MKAKLKEISRKRAYWLSVAIVGIVIGISIQFVRAGFSGPSGNAGSVNVAAPILTSGGQKIYGDPGLTIDKSLYVNEKICLKGQCITEWPASGSGTGYIPGNKIFNTPGSYTLCIGSGGSCDFHTADNVSQITIRAWGGGGGGAVGRFSVTDTTTWNGNAYGSLTVGGGGGSGGYVIANNVPVSQGQVYTINVGLGGAGGSTAYRDQGYSSVIAAGGTGQTSCVNTDNSKTCLSFDNSLVRANGGQGGHDWDGLGNRDQFGNAFPEYLVATGFVATGGTASATVAGAVTQNGNAGGADKQYATNYVSCDYTSECFPSSQQYSGPDNIAGGAAVADAAYSGFGAGGAGRKWADWPKWECSVFETPVDQDGQPGTPYDTGQRYTLFAPGYPGGTCGQIVPAVYPNSNSGAPGAVVVTW